MSKKDSVSLILLANCKADENLYQRKQCKYIKTVQTFL